jgi:uncharacterized protein YbjT (DUF2867 family)
MKRPYLIIGATRGTGLLIAQQLLQTGANVRILARDPDKARRLFSNRASIRRGDVTDAGSVRDVIAENYRAIFFTVAAIGGIDGRGLFASETVIRNVTYQGLLNVVDSARSIGFGGRIILPSVVGVDRSSFMIQMLNRVKCGLQRNLNERELYLRASGLDYTIVRAPILTNALGGDANIHIARPIHKLTAGPKISRGDLARLLILVSGQVAASRKTFDLFSAKGAAPSDSRLLEQLEQIPADLKVG